MDDIQREKLAAIEHEQWVHWTKYFLKQLRPIIELGLSRTADAVLCEKPKVRLSRRQKRDLLTAAQCIETWQLLTLVPYDKLTDEQKVSDREWADRVLSLLEE